MNFIKNKGRSFLFHIFLILAFFMSISYIRASENDMKEYQQDMNRIQAKNKSFKPGPENNFEEYEKFAVTMQEKWKTKNPEEYAKIMIQICGTLNSGAFRGNRGYDAARKYALAVLTQPDRITLDTELELIGYIMTNTGLPKSPKGEELAQRRRKDVEIRLHAWKRLNNSIDPKWDPNDLPVSNVTPPSSTGFPSGISPDAIDDFSLRAEYEAAIEKNRKKAERYDEQYSLHKWLKRYLPQAEKYIVQLYSAPPYNNEELKQLLEKYKIDRKTQTRIINAVDANIQKEAETIERLNKLRGIK
jgi:hypothetical protein